MEEKRADFILIIHAVDSNSIFGRRVDRTWKTYKEALHYALKLFASGMYDWISMHKEVIWTDGIKTSEYITTIDD